MITLLANKRRIEEGMKCVYCFVGIGADDRLFMYSINSFLSKGYASTTGTVYLADAPFVYSKSDCCVVFIFYREFPILEELIICLDDLKLRLSDGTVLVG